MEGRRLYVKHKSYSLDFFEHSGQKGMHWYVRRWQNEDGSLTPEGRIHYGVGPARGESVPKKYVGSDGSLNIRGRIHYRTLHKNASLSDEELKEQTKRLQAEKNLEDLRNATSTAYRLGNRLSSAAEDAIVSASKKGLEKLIGVYVNKGVSKLLGEKTDPPEAVKQAMEKLKNITVKDLQAQNAFDKQQEEMIKRRNGGKIPKDFEYRLIPEEESNKKPSESKPEDKTEKKSEEKPKEQKTEKKPAEKSKEEPIENKSKEKPKKEKTEEKSQEQKTEVQKEEVPDPTWTHRKINLPPDPTWNHRRVSSSDPTWNHRRIKIGPDPTWNHRKVNANDISNETKGRTIKIDASKGGTKVENVEASRFKALKSSGYTLEQIANMTGRSISTIEKYLK